VYIYKINKGENDNAAEQYKLHHTSPYEKNTMKNNVEPAIVSMARSFPFLVGLWV